MNREALDRLTYDTLDYHGIDFEVVEQDLETFEDLVDYASTHPHIRAIYLTVPRFMKIWIGVSPLIFKRCCKVTTDSRSFIQIGNLRVMPRML